MSKPLFNALNSMAKVEPPVHWDAYIRELELTIKSARVSYAADGTISIPNHMIVAMATHDANLLYQLLTTSQECDQYIELTRRMAVNLSQILKPRSVRSVMLQRIVRGAE